MVVEVFDEVRREVLEGEEEGEGEVVAEFVVEGGLGEEGAPRSQPSAASWPLSWDMMGRVSGFGFRVSGESCMEGQLSLVGARRRSPNPSACCFCGIC